MGPPSPPVRIRVYTSRDHAAVTRLWRASGIEVGPSDSRREIERQVRRDPTLFLVAVDGPRVVGAVLGRFDGRRGWIHHLAVADDRRRVGVGRRLVAELERRLGQMGCPKVNLHVLRANADVVRFYERLGYQVRDIIFMDRWLRGGPGERPRLHRVRR